MGVDFFDVGESGGFWGGGGGGFLVESVIKLERVRPSPSGKATGFGPVIRRFESCRPSQFFIIASSRHCLAGDSDLRCESCRPSQFSFAPPVGVFFSAAFKRRFLSWEWYNMLYD